jgi:hypothetical protein
VADQGNNPKPPARLLKPEETYVAEILEDTVLEGLRGIAEMYREAIDRLQRGEPAARKTTPEALRAQSVHWRSSAEARSGYRVRESELELAALAEELAELLPALEPKRRRKSNRKITLPSETGGLRAVPNVQNHGTRTLARILSGNVGWLEDPSGAMLAAIDGKTVGRVDLSESRGPEALRDLIARLDSPRTTKAMLTVSWLIYERSNHLPVDKVVRITVGELARAMGYQARANRSIKTEILENIGHDLQALAGIMTWAADGPYDKKRRGYDSGWVAPLIVLSAVHTHRDTSDGRRVPDELDIMLGKNWARAYAETDLLQIADGLMKVHDRNEFALGLYYQLQFRYRMTARKEGATRSIRSICEEAGIDPGGPTHRKRFLDRLESWHADLQAIGVIGHHRRSPALGTDLWPSEVFANGTYFVRPPAAIMTAYAPTRQRRAAKSAHPRG